MDEESRRKVVECVEWSMAGYTALLSVLFLYLALLLVCIILALCIKPISPSQRGYSAKKRAKREGWRVLLGIMTVIGESDRVLISVSRRGGVLMRASHSFVTGGDDWACMEDSGEG